MKAFRKLILVLCLSSVVFNFETIRIEACNNFFDYCDSISGDVLDHNEVKNYSSNILSMILDSNRSQSLKANTGHKRSQNKDQIETSSKITTMLDELLNDSGYDKRLRPGLNGVPIEVMYY